MHSNPEDFQPTSSNFSITPISNSDKNKIIEQQINEIACDSNFSLKDLSPEMLNTIRKYLFVASGNWETRLTNDCSLIIKKRNTLEAEHSSHQLRPSMSDPEPSNPMNRNASLNLRKSSTQVSRQSGNTNSNKEGVKEPYFEETLQQCIASAASIAATASTVQETLAAETEKNNKKKTFEYVHSIDASYNNFSYVNNNREPDDQEEQNTKNEFFSAGSNYFENNKAGNPTSVEEIFENSNTSNNEYELQEALRKTTYGEAANDKGILRKDKLPILDRYKVKLNFRPSVNLHFYEGAENVNHEQWQQQLQQQEEQNILVPPEGICKSALTLNLKTKSIDEKKEPLLSELSAEEYLEAPSTIKSIKLNSPARGSFDCSVNSKGSTNIISLQEDDFSAELYGAHNKAEE